MRSKFEQWVLSYAQFVIRFRWMIVLLSVLIMVGMASGVKHLSFATNYRVFFSKENPQLQAFEDLQNVYTKVDNIMFVLQPREGDVFQPRVAEIIRDLTEKSWQIPYSIRVDSLSNYQHTYAEEDDLTVVDLIRREDIQSAKALQQIKQIALNEPLLVDRVVSPDGKTTGVNVTVQLPQKSLTEVPEAVAYARKLADDIRKAHPDVEVALSGMVMMNNSFSEASMHDMGTLIPMMYGILILVTLFLVRSFFSTFSTLMVILFSMMAAMGVAGYAGVQLTPPSATAPTIILTLAIADSIHILMTMLKSMQQGMDRRAALAESLRVNAVPVFITSFTTVLGFMSLNFSDTPPFWHLGNITAVGITMAWFFSMTLLPALLAIFPITRTEDDVDVGFKFMHGLGKFVVRRRRVLLGVMGVLSIFLSLMISRLELNDMFVNYFDETVEFRRDTDFMTEYLTGVYPLEYSVGANGEQGIADPEYLAKLEDFSNWLRTQPEVVHVNSITDIFKRLNKNMHGDDPAYYKLPTDRELAAQYLLLYEMSLPYGLDLNNQVNIDKSATRVTATLGNLTAKEMREFGKKSEEWLREHTPDYMHTLATSSSLMFAYISERNINSMITGNLVAILLITLVLIFALGHFGVGALSVIPNLLPVLMAMGIWALLYGEAGVAATIVGAATLGIVVDDTVHFLSKYLRARRERGYGKQEAVLYSFDTVGMALLATTIILVGGFSILSLSSFLINYQTGILSALIILIALLVDFLLLPPLLMINSKEPDGLNLKKE